MRRRPHQAARLLWLFTVWLLGSAPLRAGAETNSARAGIGGVANGTIVNGDGTGAASIIINSVSLPLIKQARDEAGTVLPDGAAVVPGQQIYFVLLVDNPADFPATDVQVTDALDEAQFAFVPGSLEECSVPTGTGDAGLWQGVWTALTDANSVADIASAVDTGGVPGLDRVTLGQVPGQANQPMQVAAGMIRAVRFRVTVQ